MTDAEKLSIAKNALEKIEIAAVNIQVSLKKHEYALALSLIKILWERASSALHRIR